MQAPHDEITALVLEDEPRFRDFLADVLRDMNCRALGAGTAREAMALIDADAPDILLLDLNLPIMDGLTFLESFRRRHPDTPVVIITAFGDLDAARRAIRLGVTDFLTKPCELGQVEAAIDRARRRLGRPKPALAALGAEPDAETIEVRSLAVLEREAIIEALRRCGGNRSEAARRLSISRRALYNKIAEYEREGHVVPGASD